MDDFDTKDIQNLLAIQERLKVDDSEANRIISAACVRDIIETSPDTIVTDLDNAITAFNSSYSDGGMLPMIPNVMLHEMIDFLSTDANMDCLDSIERMLNSDDEDLTDERDEAMMEDDIDIYGLEANMLQMSQLNDGDQCEDIDCEPYETL